MHIFTNCSFEYLTLPCIFLQKALRNLSIILRSQDRLTASSLQDSVQRSREALQLDFNDGASWYNLGNAYLTTFFYRGQHEKDLLQALSCYKKALCDEDQKSNPDLYYSLAEASRYTEDFQTALDSYVASHRFNPSWTVPLDKADNLEMYLKVGTLSKTFLQRQLSIYIKR